jgi:hypothetical protein
VTLRHPAPWFSVAVLVALAAHPCAGSQATPRGGGQPAPGETAQVGQGDLPPVSLERIRRALEHEPAIRLPQPQGPVFTVTVEGRLPRFADFVGEESLARGPAPATAMTHREFLNLVAPPQTQSFGAFSPTELLQVAATSTAFGLGSQWLVQGIRDAIRGRRERDAREEVQAVLAELERREREKQKDRQPREP